MNRARHADQVARAVLTWITEPSDEILNQLLATVSPRVAMTAIRTGELPIVACSIDAEFPAVREALARWRTALARVPADGGLAVAAQQGIRLITPDCPEWPAGLNDLGPAQPHALWARGASLAPNTMVAIAGARAASAYGAYVPGDIASGLADAGIPVVSGGAYGIDVAAHRGALAAEGTTIAVLACGLDRPHPAGHVGLFDRIIEQGGTLLSEHPTGQAPSRQRFLNRNRIIAAISAATVIIESGTRSGTMNTVLHAHALGRPLLAVPGPVTSCLSAGCHQLIRDHQATLVTDVADVVAAARASVGLGPLATLPGVLAGQAGRDTTAHHQCWRGVLLPEADESAPMGADFGAACWLEGRSASWTSMASRWRCATGS